MEPLDEPVNRLSKDSGGSAAEETEAPKPLQLVPSSPSGARSGSDNPVGAQGTDSHPQTKCAEEEGLAVVGSVGKEDVSF